MNFLVILTSFLITIASFVLAIFACFGSTRNATPLNQIYVAQLDLSSINFNQITGTQLPQSAIPSLDQLGVPSYFNLGLWSYCLADSDKNITSCTSPKGIEQFNLEKLWNDNIDSNQVTDLISSVIKVNLPQELQDRMNLYNALIKCMCITLVIGIGLLGLGIIVNILRWILHYTFVNIVGRFLAVFSFISMGICAGTGTATYVIIKNILKDNYSEYGIKLSLGRTFYALLWASVAGCLINFFLWIATRQRRSPQVIMQPVYPEKY